MRGPDTKPVEAGRKLSDVLLQLAIRELLQVALHDHLVGRLHEWRMPQLFCVRWMLICGLSDL
jgi:hypothetical protein